MAGLGAGVVLTLAVQRVPVVQRERVPSSLRGEGVGENRPYYLLGPVVTRSAL